MTGGTGFTVERTTDRIDIVFEAGRFDALSTSPGTGLVGSVAGISVGGAGPTGDGWMRLDPHSPVGSTSVTTLSKGRNTVTCICSSDMTSGTSRAGDRAGTAPGCGTNVVLIIGADMPVSSMARAAVTLTEAVTTVMQDMTVRASPGSGVSSGSVVQDITVVRDRGSGVFIHGTGKHSYMGEIIGRCARMSLFESARANGLVEKDAFDHVPALRGAADVPPGHLLPLASSLTFLRDAVGWGLVPGDAGADVFGELTRGLPGEVVDDLPGPHS
ncbi:MAG: adenosylcobinamide amidohydrolase [Candidatus Methanomethylophilaceae archaeon]|nr:adenosylcobinamide amidohydrolase [Candidatus Methanomethylophilaceae archaeon]